MPAEFATGPTTMHQGFKVLVTLPDNFPSGRNVDYLVLHPYSETHVTMKRKPVNFITWPGPITEDGV